MNTKTCRMCNVEKEITKYSKYYSGSNRIEKRYPACRSCYNKKYNPWTKKPMTSVYDCRFKWADATEEEKLQHIKMVFDKHVIKKEGCWDWQGCLSKGYAALNYEHKQINAHRISWIINKGDIPSNAMILHHCDNRKCTNPEHLYIGDSKLNAEDRVKRNRSNPIIGSNHPTAVLDEQKVREIKRLLTLNTSVATIAKKFDCSAGAIQGIRKNITWKHVI